MALLEKELASAPTPENWQQVIDRLFDDVTGWAQAWLGEVGNVRLDSAAQHGRTGLGSSQVLVIDIPPHEGMLVPKEELVLEPTLLNASAGMGFVDFFVYPMHHRVLMVYKFQDQRWSVKTESELYWPHPWGQDTFVEIAEGFLRA